MEIYEAWYEFVAYPFGARIKSPPPVHFNGRSAI